MFKGYDYFTPSPNSVDEILCKVCGEICDVERNVSAPTSWAAAMAEVDTIHDSFRCPYGEEEWHTRARKLVQCIESCDSVSIKKIMNDDLNKTIKEGLEK